MIMDAGEAAPLDSLEQVISVLRNISLDSVKSLDDFLRLYKRTKIISTYPGSQHVHLKTPKRVYVGDKKFYKGDKLYPDLFSADDLSRLIDFANELRVSGQNGKLSGETFCSYNQHTSKKMEFIQFGVPMFEQIKVDETNQFQTRCIEPIPALLRGLIEQVIVEEWIPENRRPNGCRINFFDEGEYSHPSVTPPHLEHPISTFFLSESRLALGDTIPSDGRGNYYDYLGLPIDEGSLLVMNGNGLGSTMHAMCPSPNKRITITFFKALG